MRKVIYTVITGKVDTLKNPSVIPKGWDLVCFTDDHEIRSDVWKIKRINISMEPKKKSRYVKIMAHEFLPEYDLSLYIDSYIVIAKDINEFIDKQLKQDHRGFIVKKHHSRKNIDQEAARLILTGKEDVEVLTNQVSEYKSRGFKYDILFENGIMIRKHLEPNVIELCSHWWSEVERHSYRDQISLPYVSWKLKFKIGFFTQGKASLYFHILTKKNEIKGDLTIFEGTPYDPELQYGRVLNEFCQRAPDDSWIIIRDRDTMYLTDNGKQIIDIIKKNPDTGVFGCKTNRLGLRWQVEQRMEDEKNIRRHVLKAEEMKEKHGTEIINLVGPAAIVGGMFMCFHKSTWERVKFREGNIVDSRGIYFDADFCMRVQKLGKPIRLMMGVYLFHLYRLGRDKKDIKHLIG